MASEARYRLLAEEQDLNHYIRIHYHKLALFVLSLPFSAFVFCIVYSLIYNFETSTSTLCHAQNVLPSVSAAIGGYSPQIEVWKYAILLHAPPRFMMVYLYRLYNFEVLHRSAFCLAQLTSVLNLIENLALVSLSLFDSSNHYPLHEKSFITFILTSELYMLLMVVLQQTFRQKPRNQSEMKGLKWKKILVTINILSILLATYYFIQHNTVCTDYAYSWFAFYEYIVVFSNMAYHMTAMHDFSGKDLVIHRRGIHLIWRYS